MTVRHFDGVDDKITTSPVTPNFLGHGTLAALWRPDDTGNHGIVCGDASGFERWVLLPVAGDAVYVQYTGFTTVHTFSADEWYLTIVTKPAASSVIRKHTMPFSTGVWTHADSATTLGDTGGANTAMHFGWSLNANFFLEGDLAVIGIWVDVELSDAECETLPTGLADWVALSPSGLWPFNQESVGDPVLDITGNGADQTAITGTSVLTGDDPPGFNFSLETDTHFYRDGGLWVPTTRHVRQAGAWVEL